MIKLLRICRISTISPLLFGCLGGMVLAVVLAHANSAAAQTRRSASSIPYSYAQQAPEPSRSSTYSRTQEAVFKEPTVGQSRVNPIRLARAQAQVTDPSQEDPFGPSALDTQGFDDFDPESLDFPPSETSSSDVPEGTPFPAQTGEPVVVPLEDPAVDSELDLDGILEDDDEPLEITDPLETLPTLQQNRGATTQGATGRTTTTPTRPKPTGIQDNPVLHPQRGMSLDDLDKVDNPEERKILDVIREQAEKSRPAEIDSTSPQPKGPTKRPMVDVPSWEPKGEETTTRPPTKTQPQPQPQPTPQPTETVEQYPPQPTTEPMPPVSPGKQRPARRGFQDCGVGPAMMFEDHCGYPPEIAPFNGIFVEKPYAPLFDFGGSGVDFFGYEQGCGPVRPCGWLFDNMEVFIGANGFGLESGPLNETSFGIHEGVNWAGSISPRFGLAAQFGVRSVQRTIDGSLPLLETADWNNRGKTQTFIPAGFFKRAQSNPFQFGIVYDWMSDNKYKNLKPKTGNAFDAFNIGQVRTELSYKCPSGFAFGFRGMFGVADSDVFGSSDYTAKATTQLHGFFEKPLWCGSLAGFSAGGTPKGNAILAAYYDQPLSDKFSMKAGFTYMLPKHSKDDTSAFADDDRSAWEAAISVTFHPHGGAFSKVCNPLRAMFDVAGNGSMITTHRK